MSPTACGRCGTPLYADDQYCVGCGHPADAGRPDEPSGGKRVTRLMVALDTGAHAAIRSCEQCGGAVFPEDRFCQSCGARVA